MILSVKEKKSPELDTFIGYEVTYSGSENAWFVPKNEENTDYQAILEWVAEGNTIEPADEE